ncbi:MAG: hypothetical protein WCX22_09395 [Methanoregula sp.]
MDGAQTARTDAGGLTLTMRKDIFTEEYLAQMGLLNGNFRQSPVRGCRDEPAGKPYV